jgi:hypothetical protein
VKFNKRPDIAGAIISAALAGHGLSPAGTAAAEVLFTGHRSFNLLGGVSSSEGSVAAVHGLLPSRVIAAGVL